jgi:hypothetical protein
LEVVTISDFVLFTDGSNAVLESGITGSCSFALSTKTAEELGAATKAGSFSEITGTGYARISETAPASAGGKKTFAPKEWKTETHTDWPAGTKSVVMLNASVAICAWNLREGGGARDMSGASTTETFSPVLQLS